MLGRQTSIDNIDFGQDGWKNLTATVATLHNSVLADARYRRVAGLKPRTLTSACGERLHGRVDILPVKYRSSDEMAQSACSDGRICYRQPVIASPRNRDQA
jgi:hypothetical protein